MHMILDGELRELGEQTDPILPTPLTNLLPLPHLLFCRLRHKHLIRTEPILDPAKKPPCCILSKRISVFRHLDDCIRMADDGRGNKDGGARGEVDHKAKIPEDDVTTSEKVEFPKGRDGAPSEGEVPGVCVGKGDSPGAEIERSSGPGTFLEIAA